MLDKNAEVIQESRWSRTYRVGSIFPVYASKFLTDDITLDLKTIKGEWDAWSESERLEFAQAYKHKREVSVEDEGILSFLMDRGDDRVWVSVARLLTKHSDRQGVLKFLSERLRSNSSEPKATFIAALKLIGGPEAFSAVEEFHDEARSQIRALGNEADPALIMDFMHCCSALVELKARDPYMGEIEAFLSDGRDAVRLVAARILREVLGHTG